MKFPRILLAVAALCIVAAMTTSCGSSPASQQVNHIPPPPVTVPPTGTNYTTCADKAGNSQLVPNWQSSLFISNYQAAITALVNHYSGNASVGYIRIGLGRGGEINLPQGWNDSSTGACYGGFTTNWAYTVGGSSATSSTWNSYLGGMISFESPLSTQALPLLVSITPVNGTSDNATDGFIASFAVQNGLSYGNQGLQASDIPNFNSGQECGANWCNLFASNHPQIAEMQTLGQSCPAGTTCVDSLSASTGPLDPLIPFAIARGSNDLELYYEDWLIAYDANYASSVGATTATVPYAAAIQAGALTPGVSMQVLFPDPTNPDIATYLMSNSAVTGAVISVDWSDFDIGSNGAHSSYDFSITDAAIAPWINSGKKVNLVLQNLTYGGTNCTSGSGSNGVNGTGNCAMPAWMWTVLK